MDDLTATAQNAEEPKKSSTASGVTVLEQPARIRSWIVAHRRVLIVTASAAVFATAATIGGIAVATAVREENEARSAAVDDYEEAFDDYESAASELNDSIAFARTTLEGTQADSLEDPVHLARLESQLTFAENDADDLTGVVSVDLDSASRQEVETSTEELEANRRSLYTSKGKITAAVSAVTTDQQAHTDRLAAEAAAAEKARVDAEKAAAIAATKAAAQTISYEDLFRAGDSVFGTYYRFEGEIIQDAGSGTYRVNMTRDPGYSRVFWKDTILVNITGSTAQRLLEDDIISFTAASFGVQSYTTIFNATVELPLVAAEGADVSVTGRSE